MFYIFLTQTNRYAKFFACVCVAKNRDPIEGT